MRVQVRAMPRLGWATLLSAAMLSCATNPVTGKREISLMSESQEIGIGQESHPQILKDMGEYKDPELQRYVNDLGQRLAKTSERPHLPWHFTVVDQPVVNAFAVPGGFIYVTRGILAYLDSEAQLVGVLGHEIGHVTARHSAQQYSRSLGGTIGLVALGAFVPSARALGQLGEQALGVLFLKYGRDDELQSDQLGAKYAAANGWDPRGVPAFLATLGRMREGSENGIPNWLSTHPEPGSRVAEIQPYVEQLSAGRSGLVSERAGYLAQVDGIIFGDNPEQGIVRGNAFLHPPLRFRLEFPEGWEIQNSPQQVVGKAPGVDTYLFLQPVEKPAGRTAQEVGVNHMQSAGYTFVEGNSMSINGAEAFVGVYRGRSEGLGEVLARAAHIVHDAQYYVVVGLARQDVFAQADGEFMQTIRSFRSMSRAEAEAIHPNRVDLYTVRAGDTWQSIAERAGGVVDAQTLAIMNDSQTGAEPRIGARIKIVVAG